MSTTREERPARRRVEGADLGTMARGGALNLVGAVWFAIAGFVLLLTLSRMLGAGSTGAFLEAVAVFNITATVATLGVDTGLIWFIPRARSTGRAGEVRRVLRVGLLPVFLVGCVAAAVLPSSADWLADLVSTGTHDAEIAHYLRAMAPFIPVAALMFAVLGATRGLATMRPTVLIDKIVRPTIQPPAIAVVLVLGASSTALALAWSAPFGLALLLAGLWLRRLVLDAERCAGDDAPTVVRSLGRIVAEFWRFTLPRTVASVSQIVIQWLDVLLVGGIASTSTAGVYAVSTRLLQAGTFVTVAVAQVVQPMFSELLSRGERARTQEVWRLATSWQMLMAWPLYLLLGIFAEPALRLFGPEFAAGRGALMILAASRLVSVGVGPVAMLLLMGGKSSWGLYNQVAALSANVVLNILLIPRYGLTGAALAWAAAAMLNNLLPLAQVWLHLGINPFGQAVGTAAAAGVGVVGGTALGVRLLLGPTLPALVTGTVLAGLLYALLLRRLAPRLELAAAWQALRHRRRPNAPTSTTTTTGDAG